MVGATVDIARHNRISPEEAAQTVFKMVAGSKITFKAEPWMEGVGGRSLVTFSDNHLAPIKIPTARLTQLMAAREDLAAKVKDTTAKTAASAATTAANAKVLDPNMMGHGPPNRGIRHPAIPVSPPLAPDSAILPPNVGGSPLMGPQHGNPTDASSGQYRPRPIYNQAIPTN